MNKLNTSSLKFSFFRNTRHSFGKTGMEWNEIEKKEIRVDNEDKGFKDEEQIFIVNNRELEEIKHERGKVEKGNVNDTIDEQNSDTVYEKENQGNNNEMNFNGSGINASTMAKEIDETENKDEQVNAKIYSANVDIKEDKVDGINNPIEKQVYITVKNEINKPLKNIEKRVVNVNKKNEELEKMNAIGERFNRRKIHLQNTCKYLKKFLNYSPKLTRHKSLLSSRIYDILLCHIAKAGSSTWKTYILEMHDHSARKGNVHDSGGINVNKINHLGPTRKKEMLFSPDVARVISVRNPLQRLLSAYKDKFNDGGPVNVNDEKYIEFVKPCLRSLNINPDTYPNDKGISFEMFIRYVIQNNEKEVVNPHWRRYYESCSVCHFNYQYIVKLETFPEDVRFIGYKFHIPELLKERHRHKSSQSSDDWVNEYQKLPKNLIKNIYKIYRYDFLLFDYSVPDFIKNIVKRDD